MAGKSSLDKGKRAEREIVKLLQPVVTKVYQAAGKEVISLERNLMQSHKGGYDIAGLDWLAPEVKHHETLQVSRWWSQTVMQAGKDRVPVLFYRQSRRAWSVRIRVSLPLAKSRITTPGDISMAAFIIWFERRLTEEVIGNGR